MVRIVRLLLFAVSVTLNTAAEVVAELPIEPLQIGRTPQFLFDEWVVDNHWAIRYKRQAVQRVVHQAVKHGDGPLLSGDQPSHLWVVRDDDAGLFRMYYQANFANTDEQGKLPEKGRKYTTYVACAESPDGVIWTKPDLGLFPEIKRSPNNVVVARPGNPQTETCSPVLLEVPETERRGYRWLMLYRAKGAGGGDYNGIRLIGSQDGVHWDADGDTQIAHLHSDCHNTISFDSATNQYVMFCRAKHIYRAFGEGMLDTGASRRVARWSSPTLWSDWSAQADRWPQTLLIPDERDAETHFNFFYGMPTVRRHGVWFGFLNPFRMNDFIQTELVVSRDGVNFKRFPGRQPIIPYGEDGSWDDTMIFASPAWVEVGDEWWIYYSGWDGPHGTTDRTGGIGLAKIRKEGFVSLRGPRDGGVVCTRVLRWPGGDLQVNANATQGELKVRVSSPLRRPLPGFDYGDCQSFSGDSVRHTVRWEGGSLNGLAGKMIRLEFYLDDADLFSFVAAPPEGR
ncbi:MAG: hypothetical protein ACYTGL_23915 [Planctomycetota bacterium]|jgi:hypothetical protein